MQEYQDSEARRVGTINPVPLACDFIKSTKCGSSLMFERAPWQACASTQRSARSRSCGRAGQAPPSRLLVARGLPGGFHPRWLGLRVARATELVSRFGRAQALASRSAAAPPALVVKATEGVITAIVVWRSVRSSLTLPSAPLPEQPAAPAGGTESCDFEHWTLEDVRLRDCTQAIAPSYPVI